MLKTVVLHKIFVPNMRIESSKEQHWFEITNPKLSNDKINRCIPGKDSAAAPLGKCMDAVSWRRDPLDCREWSPDCLRTARPGMRSLKINKTHKQPVHNCTFQNQKSFQNSIAPVLYIYIYILYIYIVGTESIQTPLNFSLFVILQPFAKII